MELKDDFWIRTAIDLAKESKTPFGAVIVDMHQQHIGAYNTSIHDGATAHAELNAIRRINELDYDHPEELTLYTTVEPCPMCMSALIWAGIGRLVYGASIEYANQYSKQIDIPSKVVAKQSWYPIDITSGVEEENCQALFIE